MKFLLPFLLLLLLSSLALAGDDPEVERLYDRYATYGTYDPRIHSPSPQAGMIDLWQPEREREAPIDYRLTSPEPQRLWEPREWKQ